MLEGSRVTIDWASKLVEIQRLDGAIRLVECESLGFFSMHAEGGRFWAAVMPGSLAAEQGLSHSDAITKMNGEPIDHRYDKTRLWPIPIDAEVIEIEYVNAETGESRVCVVPIE